MTGEEWPSLMEPGMYVLVPKKWWERLEGGTAVFDKWHTSDNHEQFMHAHQGAAHGLHVNIDPGEAADLCFD